MWKNIKRNFIIQYNANIATTSLPGYKFTNCSEPTWIIFFWHVVLCMCLYTVSFVCLGFYYQYENSAILPVMDVLDQGSELPYPSVYLCMGYPLNPLKLRNRSNELFQHRNLSIPLHIFDQYLQSALRFQRSTRNDSFNVYNFFNNNLNFTKIQEILPELNYKTDEWLKHCYLKGISTPCNILFKPLETGPGLCFVANSIYTQDKYEEHPDGIRYHKFTELDEDWSIRFTVFNMDTAILMYLKDPRELLGISDFPTYIWSKNKNTSQYYFTINHYYAETDVRTLRKSQRKCLYHDEVFPNEDLRNEFKTNFYNKGVCLDYCHAMEFYKRCSCLPTNAIKTLPNLSKQNEEHCVLKDIQCIERNYLEVRQTNCDHCWANCNYTEYISRKEIKIRERPPITNPQNEQSSDDFYELAIDLEYWPVLQFRTLVIFSSIEYLVSLMGLFALVTGASFLTLFEIFYVLVLRFICSYYVNKEYLKEEFRKQEEKERNQLLPCIEMSLKIQLNKSIKREA